MLRENVPTNDSKSLLMSSFESFAPACDDQQMRTMQNQITVSKFAPAALAAKEPSCSWWERNEDDDDALLLMLSLLLLLLMGTLPMSLIMRRVFALTNGGDRE